MPRLTEAERREIEVLTELLERDPDEFDSNVLHYVLRPDKQGQAVFRSPALAVQTVEALERLIARARAKRRSAMRREEKDRQHEIVRRLMAERSAVRPYANLALVQAAKNTPRHRAERVLGKVFYEELRSVIRDLEKGKSAEQAEEALRARLTGRPTPSGRGRARSGQTRRR